MTPKLSTRSSNIYNVCHFHLYHLRHLNYLHCMLLSAFWKKTGLEVAHPGVDKTHDPLERRYHKYYQWVSFCLFFQVISCVAPHHTARPCPVSTWPQSQLRCQYCDCPHPLSHSLLNSKQTIKTKAQQAKCLKLLSLTFMCMYLTA